MANLSQEAIEERRRYKREWNRRNRDKCREAEARYWERKAAERAAGGEEKGEET